MSRTKREYSKPQQKLPATRRQNKTTLKDLLDWLVPDDELFTTDRFHGNINWIPEQLVRQAVIWAWQDTSNVTNAFEITGEVCEDLNIKRAANNYTSFINALDRHRDTFNRRLRQQFQARAKEVAGSHWRDGKWVLIAFDGSRATTPRTVSNEREFCASNYGKGKTAKYRKKKTKGMRRRKNEKAEPQPQVPQTWITMMWHMTLRLPWTWRTGPSNSSERGHVRDMLEEEEFPENTLFCGDAGFVGYDFWKSILEAGGDFLVRVGANVNLLSEQADVKRQGGGIVLCWPKGKMDSGAPPLRLRLVRIQIGKTSMWMLTSVTNRKELRKKQIVKYYKLRWGVEVEFRGLKQTLDKHQLRCRNSGRVYVELDWSIWALAMAELLALREQLAPGQQRSAQPDEDYDTRQRSLANTMRALRKTMRQLHKYPASDDDLLRKLARAKVEQYDNRTDKKSRYRRKNPDKKPLGDPTIRKLNRKEQAILSKLSDQIVA